MVRLICPKFSYESEIMWFAFAPVWSYIYDKWKDIVLWQWRQLIVRTGYLGVSPIYVVKSQFRIYDVCIKGLGFDRMYFNE